MNAKYLHVGIPITNKKPGMTYMEPFKVWVSDPHDHEFSIEYLKYEEGTPFPEFIHKNPHVAYEVDQLRPYLEQAEHILFGPAPLGDDRVFVFLLWDCTIIELQAPQ